jgi:hypothetical protein
VGGGNGRGLGLTGREAEPTKNELRKLGILKVLNNLIGETSDDLVQYACIALANMLLDGVPPSSRPPPLLTRVWGGTERSRLELRSLGGIKRLLALTARSNEDTRKAALQALLSCVDHGAAGTDRAGGERADARACADEACQVEVHKNSGVRPLVGLLASRSDAVQAAAAAVIGICCQNGRVLSLSPVLVVF